MSAIRSARVATSASSSMALSFSRGSRPRPPPRAIDGGNMDFALSEEQLQIQESARRFAAERLAPHALDWDERGHFPVDVVKALAELGMAGIYVRADVGGWGLSRLGAVRAFRALS